MTPPPLPLKMFAFSQECMAWQTHNKFWGKICKNKLKLELLEWAKGVFQTLSVLNHTCNSIVARQISFIIAFAWMHEIK